MNEDYINITEEKGVDPEVVRDEFYEDPMYRGGIGPSSSNFKIMAKFAPRMEQLAEKVEWSCHKKEVKILVAEGDQFEIFDWFSKLNEVREENNKTAFPDLEQDFIVLYVGPEAGGWLTRFKFNGLYLLDHQCSFAKANFGGISGLFHNLIIGYDKCERLPIDKSIEEEEEELYDGMRQRDPNEIMDSEWMLAQDGQSE